MGEKLGFNQRTISKHVRGNSQPSLETLSKICQILKIDIYYILELEKYDNSNMILSDKNEISILQCYRSLNKDQKDIFDAFIKAINQK